MRVNLDDVSADNDTLANDQERGEWLRGFLAGARGADCRFSEGSPGSMGHRAGSSSLASAIEYKAKQAQAGSASAAARLAKHGTNDPRTPLERRSEHRSDVPQNADRTPSEPIQYPISNIEKPVTYIQKTSDDSFGVFWNAYGKKTGKVNALTQWERLSLADRNAALSAVPAYCLFKPDPQFRLDPERYLKRRTWEDEAVAGEAPKEMSPEEIARRHAYIDSIS